MAEDDKSLDIFGVKPAAEASKILIEKGTDSLVEFFKTTFGPAAAELGEYFKDHVKLWRMNNIKKLADATLELEYHNSGHCQPRVAIQLVENASWNEDEELTKMWAGLLESSKSENGKDDSNITFIELMKQLTSCQARILTAVCTKKDFSIVLHENGLYYCQTKYGYTAEQLFKLSDCNDIQKIDIELDRLRSLELIDPQSGFRNDSTPLMGHICPTSLCLHFIARTNGFKGELKDFYKLEPRINSSLPKVVIDSDPK